MYHNVFSMITDLNLAVSPNLKERIIKSGENKFLIFFMLLLPNLACKPTT